MLLPKIYEDIVKKEDLKPVMAPKVELVNAKEKSEESEPEKAKQNQEFLNAVLDQLLKKTKVDISDLILDEELNTRLARLVDDVEKLGMTVDTYLQSKNTTIEALRQQYRNEIEGIHKMEFLLNEIADKRNTCGKQRTRKAFHRYKRRKRESYGSTKRLFLRSLASKTKRSEERRVGKEC